MFRSMVAILALAVLIQEASAQKPPAFGSVSGFVFCSDTNTPARLASVVLRPLPSAKVKNSAPGATEGVEVRTVQTSIDGSFSIPQVAPGRYYVLATMEGYISPLATIGISDSDLLNVDESTKTKLLAHVPTVVVEGNLGASVNVSLERGAAVAGTILFDDGSPAPGLWVGLLTRKQGKWVPVETGSAAGLVQTVKTDDRGHYRISGIPPEEESLLKVQLRVSSSRNYLSKNGGSFHDLGDYTLAVYSGDALRPGSAKPFALKPGEERPGEDVVLPLSKLHKVQGVVTMQRDGRVLNEATLSLVFADDKSPAGKTRIANGETSFLFPFVPEGDYVLQVSGAADVGFEEVSNGPGTIPPTHTETHTLHSYGSTEMPVHVDGDLLDLNIAVPDEAAHSN
jgi:hypothetical protein